MLTTSVVRPLVHAGPAAPAVFFASEESRDITGQQIRVDAGAMLKWDVDATFACAAGAG